MKNLLLLSCLMLGIATLHAQSADEAAIKQAIEAETRTWHAGDMAANRAFWHIQPYSVAMISMPDGTHFKLGAEEMKKPDPAVMGSRAVSVNTNYLISVQGTSAWSSHDQVTTSPDGQKTYTHELRMLEKISGTWKIVGMSVHVYKP